MSDSSTDDSSQTDNFSDEGQGDVTTFAPMGNAPAAPPAAAAPSAPAAAPVPDDDFKQAMTSNTAEPDDFEQQMAPQPNFIKSGIRAAAGSLSEVLPSALVGPSELTETQRLALMSAPFGRIAQQFGIGYGQAIKESENDDDLQNLKSAGILKNYLDVNDMVHKGFMDGLIVPAMKTANSVFNAANYEAHVAAKVPMAQMNALFSGASSAAYQTGEEIAPNKGIGTDLEFGLEILGAEDGLGTFHAPHGEAHGIPPEVSAGKAAGALDGETAYFYPDRATPEQATAQREAAASLPANIEPPVPPEPLPPDIHEVARQIAPETFAEYDALSEQRDTHGQALRDATARRISDAEDNSPHAAAISDTLDRLETANPRMAKIYQARLDDLMDQHEAHVNEAIKGDTPEIAAARDAYQQADYRMRDMAPDVSQAYRDAHEQMGSPETEDAAPSPQAADQPEEAPAEPEASDPAQPAAEQTPGGAEASAAPAAQSEPVQQTPSQRNASRRAVADNVTKQWVDAGHSQRQAEAHGQLVSHMMQRLSDMYEGRKGTTEDVFNKYGFDVNKAKQRAAKELAQKSPPDSSLYQHGELKTDSPAFKQWFGDSKVVDADGKPLTVYHGTTHDIEAFDRERGNIESDLGQGMYFSNSPGDTSENYAGEGPDLTQRIEMQAERIYGEEGGHIDMDEALKRAREQLSGGKPNTIPAYLSIKNPVEIGGDKETFFDYNEEMDEDAEYTGEESGTLPDLINAIREVTDGEHESEADNAINAIREQALDDGGLNASQLIGIMKSENGFAYAESDEGALAGNEVIRKIFERAGYDGFIDRTVNDKFGTGKDIGKPMAGMDEGTVHYIAFDPTQIKSVHNRGTFDPADPRILYQSVYHGTPYHFDKFTTDHMGKGEGAQAYGWGLYFAGDRKVAEYYREALSDRSDSHSRVSLNGQEIEKGSPEHHAARLLAHNPKPQMKSLAKEMMKDANQAEPYAVDTAKQAGLTAQEYYGRLQNFINAHTKKEIQIAKGQLYEADIPEDHVMLDWDKNWSDQSPQVRKAIQKVHNFPDHLSGSTAYFNMGMIAQKNHPEIYGQMRLDEASSRYLNSLGIEGIKYLDGSSRSAGEGHHNYVVFDGNAAKIVKTMYQKADGAVKKGSWQPPTEITRAVIKRFRNADASTLIHETGHHWLDTITRLVDEGGAPAQLQADLAGLKKYLGSDDTGPHRGYTTAQHEKFARTFERYMMDGISPTPGLARIFQQFKGWMMDIYKTLNTRRFPINDDVRNIFDRFFTDKPERTVIAPEHPASMMADIHDADADERTPDTGSDIRDGIEDEIDKAAQKYHPEAYHALKRAEAEAVAGPDEGPGYNDDSTPRSTRSAPPETVPESSPAGGGGTDSVGRGSVDDPVEQKTLYLPVPKKPISLSAFVHREGGIRDEGGDIRHTLGGAKYRPGLISKKGRAVDDMALHAHQKGYFPEKGEERPTTNEFLDKLSDDLNGNAQYSDHDAEAVKAYHEAMDYNENIDRITHELGIDTEGKTAVQIWDEIAEKQSIEKQAEDIKSWSEAQESDYADLERERQEWLDSRGDAWEPEQEPDNSVSLEDLENARRQENTTAETPGRDENDGDAGGPSAYSQPGQEGSDQYGVDPQPAGRPGAQSHPEDVDKAGNIRLDNLSDSDAVREEMRQAAAENNDFMSSRRTVLSDNDRISLATDMGIDPTDLNIDQMRKASQADGIPLDIRLTRGRIMLQKAAQDAAAAASKVRANSGPESLAELAEARRKMLMIAEVVAGDTDTWGRAGRALRRLPNEVKSNPKAMAELFQQSSGMNPEELYQMALRMGDMDQPGQVAGIMQDSTKPGFGKMLVEYVTNNYISGPITHTRYAIGNAINAIYEPVVYTPFAAAIGAAREVITGEKTGDRVYFGEMPAQLLAITRGSAEGFRAAVKAWRDEQATTLPGAKPFMPHEKAIQGKFGTFIRLPGRSVGSIHSFFQTLRYEQNMHGLAYRTAKSEGLSGDALTTRIAHLTQAPSADMMELARVKDPLDEMAYQMAEKEGRFGGDLQRRVEEIKANVTPEMQEKLTQASVISEATQQALHNVYMTPTDMESFTGQIGSVINKFPLAKIMVPFMKIGVDIESQALLEGTPFGLVKSKIRQDMLYRNGGARGDMALGKAAAGTALIGAVVGMASQGLITGDGPEDPAERAVWLLNHKPNTITIGNISLPYKGLGVIGMQMRFAANMYESQHYLKDDDITKGAKMYIEAFSKSILEDNWMYGVKNMLDAVYHPVENFESYLRNYVSGLIPYSVGLSQTAKEIDPYHRITKSIVSSVQAKIPGASEGLFPQRDAFGEPIQNGSDSRYVNDPVVMRLEALGMGVSRLQPQIMGVKLSDQQFDDYTKTAGKMVKMRLNAVVGQPQFATLPAGAQIKFIAKQIGRARDDARKVMMANNRDILQAVVAQKQQILQTGHK